MCLRNDPHKVHGSKIALPYDNSSMPSSGNTTSRLLSKNPCLWVGNLIDCEEDIAALLEAAKHLEDMDSIHNIVRYLQIHTPNASLPSNAALSHAGWKRADEFLFLYEINYKKSSRHRDRRASYEIYYWKELVEAYRPFWGNACTLCASLRWTQLTSPLAHPWYQMR